MDTQLSGSKARVGSTLTGAGQQIFNDASGALSNGQDRQGGNLGGDNAGPLLRNGSLGGAGLGPDGYTATAVLNATVSVSLDGVNTHDAHGYTYVCTACACQVCRQSRATPWPTGQGSVQHGYDGDIGGPDNALSAASAIDIAPVLSSLLRANAIGIVYPVVSDTEVQIRCVPYATQVDTLVHTLPTSSGLTFSAFPFAVDRVYAYVFTKPSSLPVFHRVDVRTGDVLDMTMDAGEEPYGDPLPQDDGLYFLSIVPAGVSGSGLPEYYVSVVTVTEANVLVRTRSFLPFNYSLVDDLPLGIVGDWLSEAPSSPVPTAENLVRPAGSNTVVPTIDSVRDLSGMPTPVGIPNRQMVVWNPGTQKAASRVDGGNTVPAPTVTVRPASVSYATVTPRLAVGNKVLAEYNHYNGTVASYTYWNSPASKAYAHYLAVCEELAASGFIGGDVTYDEGGASAIAWGEAAWAAMQALGDVTTDVYLPTSNTPGLRLYGGPSLPLPPTGIPSGSVTADHAYTGPSFTLSGHQSAPMPGGGEAVLSFRLAQGMFTTSNTADPDADLNYHPGLAADEHVVLSFFSQRSNTTTDGDIEGFGYGPPYRLGPVGVGPNAPDSNGVVLFWGAFIVKRPAYTWTINLGIESENPPLFASNGHVLVQMPSVFPRIPSLGGDGTHVAQQIIIYDSNTLIPVHVITVPTVPGSVVRMSSPVIRNNYLYFAQAYRPSSGPDVTVLYKVSLKTGTLRTVADLTDGSAPVEVGSNLIAAHGALWTTGGTTLYRIT